MLFAFVTLSLIAANTDSVVSPIPRTGPGPVRFYSVVHDLRRDRVILFGGRDTSGDVNHDVWVRSLADSASGWSRLEPAGPPPESRWRHAAIYDPDRDRMLIFGGVDTSRTLADLHALWLGDSLRWERLEPEGTAPAPRETPSMVLDPSRQHVLIVGGGVAEVWDLSLEPPLRWSRLEVKGKGPGVRYGQTAVLDSAQDRVLVFGGYGGNYSPLMSAMRNAPTRTHNDLWELTLGDSSVWTRLEPKGIRPEDRGHHGAGVDPARQRMLILGGGTYYHGSQQSLWAYSMSGPPRWESVKPQTEFESGPGTRLVVDRTRDRLLVFGAMDSSDVPVEIPLASLVPKPVKPPSFWGPLLFMEGFFAAYSCIGYISDGEWLAGFNLATGGFATGGALIAPGQDVTVEGQLAGGAAWIGLGLIQLKQIDDGAPNNEIVLGNFVGLNALVLTVVGVEWVASKLHGPRH